MVFVRRKRDENLLKKLGWIRMGFDVVVRGYQACEGGRSGGKGKP